MFDFTEKIAQLEKENKDLIIRCRPQANRGINATTSTKTNELLRFIPFFVAFYCLFFL